MVRPDETTQVVSRFSKLAGESPVRVSVGAPGSRPQLRVERRAATAGRRKPLWREQTRGLQHQVNPAASTKEQCESRAAHITAKVMFDVKTTDGASSLTGVWGAAHGDSLLRNRRDPSVQPVKQRPEI